MTAIIDIFILLYLMLPAYIANMTPIFSAKLNFLQNPIEKKIFGSHKTWGGLITGITVGSLFGVLQILLTPGTYFIPRVEYVILISVGALLGDLIKSFFKRRFKIKPGKTWIPWDQLDFVIGALVFGVFLFAPTISQILIIVIGSFILHVIVNAIGYALKIRKQWI